MLRIPLCVHLVPFHFLSKALSGQFEQSGGLGFITTGFFEGFTDQFPLQFLDVIGDG